MIGTIEQNIKSEGFGILYKFVIKHINYYGGYDV